MKISRKKTAAALLLSVALLLAGSATAFADEVPDGYVPEQEEEPGPVDVEAYAKEMLELIAKEREKAGVPALKVGENLSKAAMVRAAELEVNYGHVRPDGTICSTAYRENGCWLRPRSENIAKGRGVTPQDVMTGFMNSEGHTKHILEENVQYMAVGVYEAEDGALYWVQLFARG